MSHADAQPDLPLDVPTKSERSEVIAAWIMTHTDPVELCLSAVQVLNIVTSLQGIYRDPSTLAGLRPEIRRLCDHVIEALAQSDPSFARFLNCGYRPDPDDTAT